MAVGDICDVTLSEDAYKSFGSTVSVFCALANTMGYSDRIEINLTLLQMFAILVG